MLKIITPTGGRPNALNNLNHYLTNQTDQGFEWIVLNDCDSDGPVPSRCDKMIFPDWKWTGENTQAKSMLRLLQEVNENDQVLICEDDDFYHKNYVFKMRTQLSFDDLIGIKNPIYYNVKNNTYKIFKSNHHSSLCSTGIKGKMIHALKRICSECKTNLDSALWRHGGTLFDSKYCVGIKGMDGRKGIGVGHSMTGNPDPKRVYLKSLLGENEKRY